MGAEQQRHRNVLHRRKLRQQVMELVDEPHPPIAQSRARLCVERPDRHAVDANLAGVRVGETAENVQQRALPRPGAAQHRDRSARATTSSTPRRTGTSVGP